MSRVMMKASIDYISQYMEINDEVIDKIVRHCNRYGLQPDICAWYADLEDFFSDWCVIGYTKTEARKLYHGGKGEFQTFANGNIIRYVM